MRILVTGRNGQLATSLAERAAARGGVELVVLGRPELDLERPETVASAVMAAKPDLVVNAAAYTAVDKAESEPDRAFAVNRDGAAAVADAAARLGVPVVHVSTDYVFDGSKPSPYVESDATGPINVYGRSKLAGEIAVMAANPQALVLRTSWVFSPFGANFVKTMLRLGAERPALSIVGDQHGNPTSALDLAEAILAIAPQLPGAPGGLYHFAGDGSTSWHDFAALIFAEASRHGRSQPALTAIPAAAYAAPAARPANSRLDTTAFVSRFGVRPRPLAETTAETVRRVLAG